MTTEKIYAVLLADGADDELGKTFGKFIRNNDQEAYMFARSVDPEGNYFRMTVTQEVLPGEGNELEIQIHHEFVKGVIYGADQDIKQLGIT